MTWPVLLIALQQIIFPAPIGSVLQGCVLAVLLMSETGLNWDLSFGIGLIASLALGVATEFLVMRRFFDSPRLVVTVATIGLAQLLGVAALFMPAWSHTTVQSQRIDAPFHIEFTRGVRVFTADHVLVLVLAPIAIAGVGALLRFSRLGIAIRPRRKFHPERGSSEFL